MEPPIIDVLVELDISESPLQSHDSSSSSSVVGRTVGVNESLKTVSVELEWVLSDGTKAMAYAPASSLRRCATTDTTTSTDDRGIRIADAVKILTNRPVCDHQHSVRHFYESRSRDATSQVKDLKPFVMPTDDSVATMSPLQLVTNLLKVQEGRVEAYHYFEAALDKLLQQRNITTYQVSCQKVTKRFSLLSNHVRFIQACFHRLQNDDTAARRLVATIIS